MWRVVVVINTYAKFREKESSSPFFSAIPFEKALNSSNIAVLCSARTILGGCTQATFPEANHENFQTKLPTRFIELNVSTLFFSLQKHQSWKRGALGSLANVWFGFSVFAVLVTCAGFGFLQFSLWFSVFCKNDGGFSDFSAQCILRFSGFAYPKLHPAFALRPSSDVQPLLCPTKVRN